jgi:imidazolonepropionase-like amidohydrolase
MKTTVTRLFSPACIWAPLALTGPELVPEENILLEVSEGLIKSKQKIAGDLLPPSLLNHRNFICLDQGTTLLPCLTDAHVHLALDGKRIKAPPAAPVDWEALLPDLEAVMDSYLDSGVGILRDGGDCRGINLEFKKLLTKEDRPAPFIVSTGQAVRRNNVYGTFLGRGYSSAREIPDRIERLKRSGVDQLKVILSGIVSFTDYGRVCGPLLPPEELKTIVANARRLGLKVMAHASSAEAVEMAVQSGVDSIEHGYFVLPDTLKKMAEKQIAWIPTIIPVAVQVREPLRSGWDDGAVSVITRTYEEQIEKLSLAVDCGVPLGVGTDAGAVGVTHGSELIKEMLLYAEGGLGNRTVLKAATAVNAGIAGLDGRAGLLEPGCRAHMIAVRGNPLESLLALKEVSGHFVPG